MKTLRLLCLVACLAAITAVAGLAQPVTYYIAGTITSASSVIPLGTPFTGQYTYNPSVTGSLNPNTGVANPGQATYPQPAGTFTISVQAGFMGFSSLTSTTGNSITVGYNVPCCISGYVQDFFNYSATNGTSSGPLVNWPLTSISFGTGGFGAPGPLTDRSLTGVPNTLAAWGAGNMQVNISNVTSDPFVGYSTAIGTITAIGLAPVGSLVDYYSYIAYY